MTETRQDSATRPLPAKSGNGSSRSRTTAPCGKRKPNTTRPLKGSSNGKSGAGKYHARRVEYRGEVFDSMKEMKRYLMLLDMERQGRISQLRRQVRFTIIKPLYAFTTTRRATVTVTKLEMVDKAAHYTCDFLYREGAKIIIEDVKGAATARLADYGLRRKLMLRLIARHNVTRAREVFEFREYK